MYDKFNDWSKYQIELTICTQGFTLLGDKSESREVSVLSAPLWFSLNNWYKLN